MTELSHQRRAELMDQARAASTGIELAPGWRTSVYEYGGGEYGAAGIALDLYAAPIDQGRVHIVAWWKCDQGFDYGIEWQLLVMEINNGNNLDPSFNPLTASGGETP